MNQEFNCKQQKRDVYIFLKVLSGYKYHIPNTPIVFSKLGVYDVRRKESYQKRYYNGRAVFQLGRSRITKTILKNNLAHKIKNSVML